jgi:uncharacterized membrane protein SpoIIM required for sporulation
MHRDRFVTLRQKRWTRLEELLGRAGRNGPNRLSGEELLELGDLYRHTTSDLAVAQRDFPDDRLVLYLNGLLARAHPFLYRQQIMDIARAGRFVRYGFPEGYRQAGRYIGFACAAFVVAAVVAAILVAWHPSLADTLMPGEAQALRAVMEHHHLWVKSATEHHSVAANYIMLNNILVAVYAFAGGVLLGVPALLVIVQNGIMLGVVGAMVAQYGLSLPFWTFVAPHGVIELSVIFIAGGAGMMVGDAVLRPGLLPRGEALVRAAQHAARLLFGCIPLLIIAGTIEGFFSPSDAPDALKLLVAALVGVLLYSYLLGSRTTVRKVEYAFQDVFT